MGFLMSRPRAPAPVAVAPETVLPKNVKSNVLKVRKEGRRRKWLQVFAPVVGVASVCCFPRIVMSRGLVSHQT